MKLNHWEKEWANLIRKESAYLNKNYNKKENVVQKNFSDRIPDKLESVLFNAFSLSFKTIFENGTFAIEKTMKLNDLENEYKINEYAYELKKDKKSLRKFSLDARISNANNVVFSGVKGVTLGVFGVGVPDIPILMTTLFRGIYKIAMKYGYDYNTQAEQFFILTLIETVFLNGVELDRNNTTLNDFIQNYQIPSNYEQQDKIDNISQLLSTELIAVKFLQGVPIVGAVGGIYDSFFIDKILKYANLKYYRRFLLDKSERVD